MNEELITEKIQRLEIQYEKVELRVDGLEENFTIQKERTAQLFGVMEEIKGSLNRIEQAVYNREDPFKKAVFDIGMWSIKVLVGGGALIWAASKFS